MGKKQPGKNSREKQKPESNESLEKKKTQISKLDKGTEKKPKFSELLPPEEKDLPSTESLDESSPLGSEDERITSIELEEICGNLWVVLYQLGGVLKKGFEPLTDNVKKLLSPPTARCAVRYHVQDYMKDEFLILGILGIDISKRLMVKKDDVNHRGEKKKG